MCGITGFWSPSNPHFLSVPNSVSSDQLTKMVMQLKHRGPDQQEQILFQNQPFQKQYGSVGMGTARLAIVGLDGGQPISSPDQQWWVSMNGEIYNHPTLRRECIANGVTPLDNSDTAVVAALLQWLPLEHVIDRLRGMFALAIYHKNAHNLWLFRDRMGQKPLYWMQYQHGILWSSELRVLQPFSKKELNPNAIAHLLCSEYVPAPLTVYQDIHKLPPATQLHANTLESSHYWQFPVQTTVRSGDFEHWRKSLHLALHSATRLRLQADVEVGTLLSGGIDSTTITHLAQSCQPNIQSFSVSIPQQGFDEKEAIQENIQSWHLQNHLFSFQVADISQTFEKITNHMDEPLADTSLLPTWHLFQEIQQRGIKCVLSGDGADELFAGYPTYQLHHHPRLLNALLQYKSPIQKMLQRLPSNFQGVSWDFMLKRLLQSQDQLSNLPFQKEHPFRKYPWWQQHQLWMGAWFPNDLPFEHQFWDIASQWVKDLPPHVSNVGQALFLDQRMYLAEGVLSKVDRASMAHGVEVRSPFLDHRMVELAADIPMPLKLHRNQNKYLLRHLLPELSTSIQHRPKKGFGAPVAQWLQKEGSDYLKDLPSQLDGWINPRLLKQYIVEHQSGRQNHRRQLWAALCLSEWLKKHHHPTSKI